jgi:transcriptional regulator with XRE-family HTH domain
VRIQAGLSVRELAEALGVNASTLYRWEKGISRPRPAQAGRWLEVVEGLRRALDDELVAG